MVEAKIIGINKSNIVDGSPLMVRDVLLHNEETGKYYKWKVNSSVSSFNHEEGETIDLPEKVREVAEPTSLQTDKRDNGDLNE